MSANRQTTVTNYGWGVSTTTSTSYRGAVLHVYKVLPSGKILRGDHYGRAFETTDDATSFALERGYLQPHYRNTVGRCALCGDVHGSWLYDASGDGSHFRVDPQGF